MNCLAPISLSYHSSFIFANTNNIDYMDVAPTRLWYQRSFDPVLEHDELTVLSWIEYAGPGRASTTPRCTQVSTGMEYNAAMDSGRFISQRTTVK